MEQSSHDLIKQNIGLRLDNIIQLGCKLLMFDNAYHKKPMPTDEEVRSKILSVINKSTNKKRKSKIKPYAEWTEQERIAEFTRNRELIRELIRSGEIVGIQDVSDVPSDYDISKPKCLRNLADMCFFIAMLYSNYYYGDEDDIELLKVLDFFDTTISKKSHEAIGYWLASSEKKNPGAERMKELSKNRTIIIRKILEEMNIKNTGIFRTEKIKREKFFTTAKEKTGLVSEDRILKISRIELKKKNLKS